MLVIYIWHVAIDGFGENMPYDELQQFIQIIIDIFLCMLWKLILFIYSWIIINVCNNPNHSLFFLLLLNSISKCKVFLGRGANMICEINSENFIRWSTPTVILTEGEIIGTWLLSQWSQ